MSLANVAANAMVEGFTDGFDGVEWKPMVSSLLVSLIYVAVLLLVGEYIWNQHITALISIAKPAKSIWSILALVIFLWIVSPMSA